MDLVNLMYKYINRFINSDELLEELKKLELNHYSKEEEQEIKQLILDVQNIKILLLMKLMILKEKD